jgi:opacity protein-like surface antigen
MRRLAATLLALLSFAATPASAQVAQVQLAYDTYAAGIEVMQMHASIGLGPWNYRVAVDYHTTGLVGLLYRGHQTNSVRGNWQDEHADPLEFFGEGVWRGQQRRTLIDYNHGVPDVKDLQPPQVNERELVPSDLQLHTMDTLSALAQLIREVERARSCETAVHTYDGRRVLEVVARTGGPERLEATRSSIFSGDTLRCDFEGHEVAGFLIGEDNPEHRRPLHGSAWLAPMLPGAPPLPVRIAFETRWFGWATMYLTEATRRPE